MRNTAIFVTLTVIVLLLVGVVYYENYQKPAKYTVSPSLQPQPSPAASSSDADDTASINADLEQINAGDVDAEFRSIDEDINSL